MKGSRIVFVLLLLLNGALAVVNFLPQPEVTIPTLDDGIPEVSSSNRITWVKEDVTRGAVRPRICHVQILDFDGDGNAEIVACDAVRNAVVVCRRSGSGEWTEELLAENLKTPAHATVTDIDADGDSDIVVAILGDPLPSDELVGQVILLRNSDGRYEQEVLLDDVRRVADVQPGDLDGDGDIDLAVAVFGYARGEIIWLENNTGEFRDHQILSRPGVIHVPVRDFDGDGDLDLVTVVSQDEEEVWGMENDGKGNFVARQLYFTHNFDVGSGGLSACDLDGDGDSDLLLPWGDNLEYGHGWPQPYHGCVWLENTGDWKFTVRRIAQLGGTYAADTADFDGDGHLDVVLVSMSNNFVNPDNPSVVWLRNDGKQNFETWRVDHRPVELITVASGDLDGDDRPDIVAGGFHIPMSGLDGCRRLTVWLNHSAEDADD